MVLLYYIPLILQTKVPLNVPLKATDPCVPLETQNWLLEKVEQAEI